MIFLQLPPVCILPPFSFERKGVVAEHDSTYVAELDMTSRKGG